MAINQISVFVQNEKGALSAVLGVIANAEIDIQALSIADTKDFGILRIITDNSEKTSLTLAENHYVSSVTPVVAARVDNQPGGLSKIVELLSDKGIDVEYLYAFVAKSKEHAYVVLRVADYAAAEEVLNAADVKLLCQEDIAAI